MPSQSKYHVRGFVNPAKAQEKVLLRRRERHPPGEEGPGCRNGRRGSADVRRARHGDGELLAVHEEIAPHPAGPAAWSSLEDEWPGRSSTRTCTSATGSWASTRRHSSRSGSGYRAPVRRCPVRAPEGSEDPARVPPRGSAPRARFRDLGTKERGLVGSGKGGPGSRGCSRDGSGTSAATSRMTP